MNKLTIGQKIKRARESQSLTMQALGERADNRINASIIYRLEKEEDPSDPRWSTIDALSKALGYGSVEEFLFKDFIVHADHQKILELIDNCLTNLVSPEACQALSRTVRHRYSYDKRGKESEAKRDPAELYANRQDII